ncbi:LPS biosynthesis protein [Thiohalobacter sp. COW1]|uniref:DegT/DnrJ/EryC1/StrS family aminotransferase n=1 Tax=Thiohalobacter sp. COW1 TaxID=2795687 RepID=UPI00191685C9|nr:DegT/DnrJ/EryC1/StrS family aminotransferase [Thiohalobacter sp. COW1]BCO30374.1 LPS biosynthesis protein [Thiohalobacter sp. COW1]
MSDIDSMHIPFALPSIGDDEISAVVETMKSGWLTTGDKCCRFEEAFANYVGAKHALTVNSATSGLHLALEAAGVGPGDKVLTSPYTFTATAEVIRYLGADPVFIDIDPDTMNIDVELIEEAINTSVNVKAIIPVHIAGQACDMDPILDIARKYGLVVVEDAAHALPTTYKGSMVGAIGDITVYSFYVTKTITTGEGGMVVTDNDEYAGRIKTMRLHGINRDVFDRYRSTVPAWYYEVVAPGYKYNMTDISAAIGLEQLKKADSFRKRREQIACAYTHAFSGLPLKVPVISRPDDMHAWHLYIIQLDTEATTITRDKFIELMFEQGIGTSVHFIPLHLHPYWKERYGFETTSFMTAFDVYNKVVSLPIYPSMSDNDVDRVIAAVRSILG